MSYEMAIKVLADKKSNSKKVQEALETIGA